MTKMAKMAKMATYPPWQPYHKSGSLEYENSLIRPIHD